LKQYETSLKAFIRDGTVAEELLIAIREPGRSDLPSPRVLRERWNALDGRELPSDTLWTGVAAAFRRQAVRQTILSGELRELLNAQNLQQLRELIERRGGVKVQPRRDRYSQRMRIKYSPVDLANLMPAYAEDPGRMVIRDVFVPQYVRANPPAVEIPKDLAEWLRGGVCSDRDNKTEAEVDTQRLDGLQVAYVSQSARPVDDIQVVVDNQRLERLHAAYANEPAYPVLDVLAVPSYRLLVLTGEPGSGKSTLMRYLLTSLIDPPVDCKSGKPLSWTSGFKEAFPLLIELRDFYALRRSNECDNFLEYVAYMGKTDQWFLDDLTVHQYIEDGSSLVMFDGLDEIFDSAARDRIMQEIAGFAQRYPRARIIVTSRPVGYKEQVLRDAGFTHFGIEDLDDAQIDAFVHGWFALTFPQQPQQAEQRIERVLGSVHQSKPIRLLAGNPMLLTIMALLAREQELPRERAKFYEKAVEVLCHHWDVNRNLQLPEDRYLNADDKKALLRRVAMRMQAGEAGLKGNIIQEDDLEEEIQAFLIDEHWHISQAEAKKATRRMIRQLRERNYILCLRGPHLYGFVHRTFLEYLTAAEFVRRFDRQPQQMTIDDLIDLFDRHCRKDDWREVLRLICAQVDEQFVARIIKRLVSRTNLDTWDGESALWELPLAIWCLCECRNLAKLEAAGASLMRLCLQWLEGARNEDQVFDFWFKDVIPACQEIGERWPGKSCVYNYDHPRRDYLIGNMQPWVALVAAVDSDRAKMLEIAQSDEEYVRTSALWFMAKKWPDETTRKLLQVSARKDWSEKARCAALEALAEKWPNETTLRLLVTEVASLEPGWIRSRIGRMIESLRKKLLPNQPRSDPAT